MRKQKQTGFTLLELLIVITIIGILASITIVSYPSVVKKAKLANAIKFSDNVRGSLQPDMVAWWKFDETVGNIAKDTWWSELHGTVYGATWVEGIKGGALSFDGVNDYVGGINAGSFTTGGTISFWFKSSGKHYGAFMRANSWSNGVSMWGSNSETHTRISDGTTGGNMSIVHGGGDMRWHYVALIRSGENIYSYVDGKRSITNGYFPASITITGLGTVSVNNIRIGFGEGHVGVNNYFGGFIDDVQIYSAALPLSMIQQHYAEGLKTHQNLAKLSF